MGFMEEKERLAGLDAESSLARARADFDSFWRAFAAGHGRAELERALAVARGIAEGDYDRETRRRARRLVIAARGRFARRATDCLNRSDLSASTFANLQLLAETFTIGEATVGDRFLALESCLRIAAIKSQFERLSDGEKRAVLRELGIGPEGDGPEPPGP